MYRIKLNPNVNYELPAVATIGNFDGLHLGHLQLFKQLNLLASQYTYRRLVITFEPLPLEYFSDQKKKLRPSRLSLLRDKFKFLRDNNLADELVVIHFGQSIANLSPGQFIHNLLKQDLGVVHVAVGHDFKFGKKASGTIDDFAKYGLKTYDMPPFYLNEYRVSSSLIRDFASNNKLDEVKKFLGHNITYTSRVIYGNQLGRKFNVPTINLSLGLNCPALWGIYIAHVYIDGICYNSVASIGKNPTVSTVDNYKLEAHLLDVNLDLYGKIATIEILEFMREERKFDDLDSLFKQIYTDLQMARDYFMRKAEINGL
ncbi:MAG: ribF [Burkholderiales bacterium]|jgi:riboflavin kinase/FMN adenylyltransferase|nr:ribF [Burkholderiales bacterium]